MRHPSIPLRIDIRRRHGHRRGSRNGHGRCSRWGMRAHHTQHHPNRGGTHSGLSGTLPLSCNALGTCPRRSLRPSTRERRSTHPLHIRHGQEMHSNPADGRLESVPGKCLWCTVEAASRYHSGTRQPGTWHDPSRAFGPRTSRWHSSHPRSHAGTGTGRMAAESHGQSRRAWKRRVPKMQSRRRGGTVCQGVAWMRMRWPARPA